jgi:hypothetical protein
MRFGFLAVIAATFVLQAQEAPIPPAAPPGEQQPAAMKEARPAASGDFIVDPGTRIPLSLINSVSTKNAGDGERVYLETAFPIVIRGRIVIPPGSYVAGTITHVKRPGRVKGKGEMYLRFDSLTLPNGVTRDFRARVGSLDGQTGGDLDKAEGKIRSESNRGGDARTVGEAAAAGASIGVIAGSAAGSSGMGAGIGAAAGATAGLLGVLLSRGPDVVLTRGSTVEMVLDRPLAFDDNELVFGAAPARRGVEGPAAQPAKKQRGVPVPGRGMGRLPL